jgi:dolichol-phosphate mannosyltransferase
MGLGTAYIAGFAWALERGYDFIFEMDADFSHDPAHLPDFLRAIESADLVLGSRYRDGKVTVVNWPIARLALSYFANVYARAVTGLPVWDATGGFKCFRRKVLEAIDFSKVRSNGYAFQIEMSFRAWKRGVQDRRDSDRLRGPHGRPEQDVQVHCARGDLDGLAIEVVGYRQARVSHQFATT